MGAKHTPGPWMITRKAPYSWVAECHPYWVIAPEFVHDTEEADARLIAAAPEMLAALKAARQFIENGIEFGFVRMPDPSTPDPAHNTLPAINAAIAAATGSAE